MQKRALPPQVAMVITNNECGFSGSSKTPDIQWLTSLAFKWADKPINRAR